jgi:hypothetical protein
MWFRVKDLLLQVGPQEMNPDIDTSWIHCFCTQLVSPCGVCTENASCDGCTVCTPTCATSHPTIARQMSIDNLATLRAELQEQLARVQEAEERLKPRTAYDFQLIEDGLSAALEEVRRLKAELSDD